MITLGLEVRGNELVGVLIQGDQQNFDFLSGQKLLKTPQGATEVFDVLNFKTDFAMLVDIREFDQIALCEGNNDSSRFRVRMEFAILSVCEDKNIPYHTYPSNACTKMITSGFEKITGRPFNISFDSSGFNKYCEKAFAAAFRFTQ